LFSEAGRTDAEAAAEAEAGAEEEREDRSGAEIHGVEAATMALKLLLLQALLLITIVSMSEEGNNLEPFGNISQVFEEMIQVVLPRVDFLESHPWLNAGLARDSLVTVVVRFRPAIRNHGMQGSHKDSLVTVI
jgi:hypothetical protein